MLLAHAPSRKLGNPSGPTLEFREGPKPAGSWAGTRRLYVGGEAAFTLSYWCGTCQFVFRRAGQSTGSLTLPLLTERLNRGLTGVDVGVLATISDSLPVGDYLPVLLSVQPRQVSPGAEGDYFAHEQVDTWGADYNGGQPVDPGTPYYRTFETPVDKDAHLYEFVVPLVPPSWNDTARVAGFKSTLAESNSPTALAISVLDVCQPAVQVGPDYYEHWALTHFLLDGHHKSQAAAETGSSLQLLALVNMSEGLSSVEQVARVVELRKQSPGVRIEHRQP